jgi:hypothetical protein
MKIRSEDTSRTNAPASSMYDTMVSAEVLVWRSGESHPFSAAQKSTMAMGVETNWNKMYNVKRLNTL